MDIVKFIKGLFGLLIGAFKSNSLESHFKPKKVNVMGIVFHIVKIDPLHYLDGSQVLMASYATYKVGSKDDSESTIRKLRKHQTDVIMAGVSIPKLSREESGDGIFVDKLFTDLELVNSLYAEIINYTYGQKKKNLLSSYRKKSSLN